jgi:hypothetical protein
MILERLGMHEFWWQADRGVRMGGTGRQGNTGGWASAAADGLRSARTMPAQGVKRCPGY